MKILKLTLFAAFSLMATFARADTMVLVQGYLGNAGSWRATGITAVLNQNGWADAGHLSASPFGIIEWPANTSGKDRFYTIDLPTEAPVSTQASYLAAYLKRIGEKHDDKLVLVGHSAGGVVARTAMVSYPGIKVDELITIASPNRGTGVAETGLDLADSPIGFFAPFFGAGTLNRSRDLYLDLIRERPGSFLNWLNTRKHPDADYVAIMRSPVPGLAGDDYVPGWSQDMRGIVGLEGHRVSAFLAPGPHGLTINDGAVILGILGNKTKAAGS